MSENQSPVVIENEYHVETVEQAIETEKRMGAASPETRKLMIQVAIAKSAVLWAVWPDGPGYRVKRVKGSRLSGPRSTAALMVKDAAVADVIERQCREVS